MEGVFRLSHASATTGKAVEAAARVEEIVGAVVNGNRRAWSQIDVEDIALLIQYARDAAASPDWLSKMAVETLAARAEAAEGRAAQAEADARLMLHELVALDESEGTNVIGYWRSLGLTDAECGALEAAGGRYAAVPDADLVAALRRILAGVQP